MGISVGQVLWRLGRSWTDEEGGDVIHRGDLTLIVGSLISAFKAIQETKLPKKNTPITLHNRIYIHSHHLSTESHLLTLPQSDCVV